MWLSTSFSATKAPADSRIPVLSQTATTSSPARIHFGSLRCHYPVFFQNAESVMKCVCMCLCLHEVYCSCLLYIMSVNTLARR